MNLSIIIGSSIKYMSYHYLKLHISNNIKSNNYLKLKLYMVYFAFIFNKSYILNLYII